MNESLICTLSPVHHLPYHRQSTMTKSIFVLCLFCPFKLSERHFFFFYFIQRNQKKNSIENNRLRIEDKRQFDKMYFDCEPWTHQMNYFIMHENRLMVFDSADLVSKVSSPWDYDYSRVQRRFNMIRRK